MRGGKRVQFNMFVRKIDQIDLTQNLRTVLMPMLWVDEVRVVYKYVLITAHKKNRISMDLIQTL